MLYLDWTKQNSNGNFKLELEANKMAKFRVMYKSTDYVYLDVEANSLEEAKEIAEKYRW